MAFVSDSFTEAADTTLASHTGEVGATWTKHGSYTETLTVKATPDRVTNSTGWANGLYYASGAPPGAEYKVLADLYVVNNSGLYAAIAGRIDTAAATFYKAEIATGTPSTITLQKVVTGTATVLGTYNISVANGSTYPFKLTLTDASKKVAWNGTEDVITSTDNAITAAGKAGIFWPMGFGGSVDRAELDNFVADTLTSTWTYTGTGGLRVGGAAHLARERVYRPAGGLLVGGGAHVARERPYRAAGGLVVGGAAGVRWFTPSMIGSVWIEGTRLHWIDDAGWEWGAQGAYLEHRGDLEPGSVTTIADEFHYIDQLGDHRSLAAIISYPAAGVPGSVWIEGGSFCFVGEDHNKKYLHTDLHSDAVHGDSHGDTAHADSHGDTAHTDSHSDTPHTDSHGDTAHSDAHGDVPHTDAHGDVAHGDHHTDSWGPYSDAHLDELTHTDIAHGDAHGDRHGDLTPPPPPAYQDAPHSDWHTDTHDDAHGDHYDYHSDIVHSDTHTDVVHTDSHDDGHTDSHSDVLHSDVHGDVAHADSHGDVAHADSHGDAPHEDIHTDEPQLVEVH